jgi:flavin-binding protein dodecin
MPGTYKMIDVVGTSAESLADAVRSAVRDAGRTVRNMDWFEVLSQRGAIVDGEVNEFQVTVRIGFKIEMQGSPTEPPKKKTRARF